MIDEYRRASFAHRLKIPVIYGLDSVHGAGPVRGATILPHNIGLGASVIPRWSRRSPTSAGDETAGVGADFPFAPVLAVARDERWGRTYEAFGETTELASHDGHCVHQRLAAANRPHPGARQRQALRRRRRHGERRQQRQHVGQRRAALRTMHVDPYKPAIAAGLGSVMASYSSWQGTRMHANKTMLTDVLKGELGFKGFVASDYNGCFQDGLNGGTCLDAGVDMFMTASFWSEMPAPMVTPTYFLERMRPLYHRTGPARPAWTTPSSAS